MHEYAIIQKTFFEVIQTTHDSQRAVGLAESKEDAERMIEAFREFHKDDDNDLLRRHGSALSGNDHCHAARDGECMWRRCPQIRDDEPKATGRHCPLDH